MTVQHATVLHTVKAHQKLLRMRSVLRYWERGLLPLCRSVILLLLICDIGDHGWGDLEESQELTQG